MGQPVDTADLPSGTVIGGKYRVTRCLGVGGMGAVYEAENSWTTRRVAIKLLQASVAKDTEAVQRFRREAVAATKLAHPNIVDVLDMGEDAETGSLYLVQEFLEGRDLRAHLDEKKRLSTAEAFELLVPVVAALTAAHRRGILHRDLKPENIFLVRSGSTGLLPKVIDFGLAKFLGDSDALTITRTGAVMGTPYYMSPEQVRGDKSVDGRADVWAIGAVLYELVSGAPPYEAPNYNMLMFKIHTELPPRIETVFAEVSPALAEVIHWALEPDLERRTPTMAALLEAIASCAYLPGAKADPSLRERHRAVIEMALEAPRTSEVHAMQEPPKQGFGTDPDEAMARTMTPAESMPPTPSAVTPSSQPAHPAVTPAAGTSEASRYATPFGWNHNSQQDAPRRNKKRAVFAGVAAAVVVGVLVAVKLAGGPSATPTAAATPTRIVSPVVTPPTVIAAPAAVAPTVAPLTLPSAEVRPEVTAPTPGSDSRGRRGRHEPRTPPPRTVAQPTPAQPAAPRGGGDFLVPVGER